MEDDFGDRMKLYEGASNPRLLPGLPVLARLDGRGFHAFTRSARRPFSEAFHARMLDVTRHLVVKSCATVGYTQSDEISLAWVEHPFFDGNPQKMCSTLAAMASAYLNVQPRDCGDGLAWRHPSAPPTFDCRVWAVPSVAEAANVFLWRQQDASRNSVQMAARHHFSHRACHDLSGKELQEKLHAEAGVNWNDYPPSFKRGTFVKHAKTRRAFTIEEIERLPERHDARRDPSLVVERRVLTVVDLDLRTMTADGRARELFTDEAATRHSPPT